MIYYVIRMLTCEKSFSFSFGGFVLLLIKNLRYDDDDDKVTIDKYKRWNGGILKVGIINIQADWKLKKSNYTLMVIDRAEISPVILTQYRT